MSAPWIIAILGHMITEDHIKVVGLLTKAETAKKLKVTVRTVDSWMADGTIPFIRIGKKAIRFDWGEVMGAIKSN